MDGVFACDHIGDSGAGSGGLFGRGFGFGRHDCCCGRKIRLEAWKYEQGLVIRRVVYLCQQAVGGLRLKTGRGIYLELMVFKFYVGSLEMTGFEPVT